MSEGNRPAGFTDDEWGRLQNVKRRMNPDFTPQHGVDLSEITKRVLDAKQRRDGRDRQQMSDMGNEEILERLMPTLLSLAVFGAITESLAFSQDFIKSLAIGIIGGLVTFGVVKQRERRGR